MVHSTIAPAPPSAARRIGSSAIRDLLRLTERPDVISLAGGLPDPAGFPVAAIAEATRRVLHDDPAALQYSVTEGHGPLRAWIAAHRSRTSGDATSDGDPDRVLVTHGAQQALDLVLRAFVEPGDSVALADPCYVGALQLLRLARAELLPIGQDEHGLLVDELADRLRAGARPRVVYVVANFHNPTGATMPADRRRALADLADRYGFLVVDDDPYGELRWQGTPVVPLAELSDRVVTLGSFSKVLSPGLRIGYAVGGRDLIADLTIVKQAADLHTSSLSQRIVLDVVSRPGFLDAHLARLRAGARERADALVAALHAHLGEHLSFTAPEGGMFVWATWRDRSIDSHALLADAIAAGMAYVPGAAFAAVPGRPEGAHRASLRLSFATASPADLDRAAQRLFSVLPV